MTGPSTDLTAVADALLTRLEAEGPRLALPIYAADHLRQTLFAFRASGGLPEHPNPGDATLQVLRGTVRLTSGERVWEGSAGELRAIPADRHVLDALTDAVVLLTVAPAR